jgi:carbonic anhydrase
MLCLLPFPGATESTNLPHHLSISNNQVNNFVMKCENSLEYPCGESTIEGVLYRMTQVHFHSPSEYSVDGKGFPLEAHFVHTSASTGGIAVVGVTFELGSENPELAKVFAAVKAKGSERVDLSTFFDGSAGTFTFNGSLTTPPCTEGIRWVVSRSSVQASQSQIDMFLKFVGNPNNRPIHPENKRGVVCNNALY